MIGKAASTVWQLRQSRFRFPAPKDQIEPRGTITRVVPMPSGLRDYLFGVYEKAGPEGTARVTTAGVFVGSIVLTSARHGLRTYLFPSGRNAFPHELPPREHISDEVNLTDVKIRQSVRVWSLSEMVEHDFGVPVASVMEYGLAIVDSMNAYPEMNLRVVDPRGKTTQVTFNLPSLDFTQ